MSNPRRTTPVTRNLSGVGNVLSLKTTMPLRKGATFHSPTSPTSSAPPQQLRVPTLLRRSQTNLDDVVDAHRRRVALTLGNIDKSLANSTTSSTSGAGLSIHEDSLPVPQGVLDHTVMDTMAAKRIKQEETERRVLRPRHNRRSSRHHFSDSGLGTSVADSADKRTANPSVKTEPSNAKAITRSGAAGSSTTENLPRLGSKATNRIHEHILKPLLAKASLKDFHPIVLDCPRRIQEQEVVCLRDLEKTLMFMAPERTKTADLYLDFCLTSIRCIQATVEYLNDREQTRPRDRPYTNGYFIDLVEQIRQYARQLSDAKDQEEESHLDTEMDIDPSDEVRLHGGLAESGRPAELIRVKKNGKAYSIATGEAIDDLHDDIKGPIKIKRSLSEQLEDDEEIMRSMARRKKNPTAAELAPKKCKEPGCTKEFKRPCDLTKHEKTHSRPWKCPVPSCKYHEYGWPTEKEMDRHHNDKHSSSPAMYECQFKPCPYKSKRESNCKQHMEKAHNWTYVRTKTNGKKGSTNADSTANQTPVIPSMLTPTSESGLAPSPQTNSAIYTGPNILFPVYDDPLHPLNPRAAFMPGEIDLRDYSPGASGTPSSDAGHGEHFAYPEIAEIDADLLYDDIYSAPVHLPTVPNNVFAKNTVQQPFPTYSAPELLNTSTVSHISPTGEGNVMLFTPKSMVDEGFEEYPVGDSDTDFLLYDALPKTDHMTVSLFGEIPSVAAGYSQPSSQDFVDWHSKMEWTHDFSNYQQH